MNTIIVDSGNPPEWVNNCVYVAKWPWSIVYVKTHNLVFCDYRDCTKADYSAHCVEYFFVDKIGEVKLDDLSDKYRYIIRRKFKGFPYIDERWYILEALT